MQACCEIRITGSRKLLHIHKNYCRYRNKNFFKDERVLPFKCKQFYFNYLSYTLQLLFYTRSNTSKWKFQLKIFITPWKFLPNESWEKQFCKSKFSLVVLLSLCSIIIRYIKTYKWATTGLLATQSGYLYPKQGWRKQPSRYWYRPCRAAKTQHPNWVTYSQWWAKWRLSTFDLYPWGEGHGVQGQICNILRPQLAMNRFLTFWGGSIFRKTPDIGLASYNIIPPDPSTIQTDKYRR